MDTEHQHEQALKEKALKGSKMIWVTFRKEGLHKYPAALDDPKLATGGWDDVSFLGYVHRHIFHFQVASGNTDTRVILFFSLGAGENRAGHSSKSIYFVPLFP